MAVWSFIVVMLSVILAAFGFIVETANLQFGKDWTRAETLHLQAQLFDNARTALLIGVVLAVASKMRSDVKARASGEHAA